MPTIANTGKTTAIHARIEPELKKAAEQIFAEVGLTMSEAIKLFLNQVRLSKGLPFEVKIPNRETRKAFANSEAGIGAKRYSSAEDAFREYL